MQLGGLAGVPFAGREGWGLYRDAAAAAGQTDLLVVYSCHATVDPSTGLVAEGGARSAMLNAWEVVDAVGGIAGLQDELLRDRHNTQQSYLYLRVAADYEHIAAHPEPLVKLAYSNFALAQDYLREIIDWSELRDVRLATLGGITLSVPQGPSANSEAAPCSTFFLPVTFELLDAQEGTLHDLLDDVLPEGTERPYKKFLFPIDQSDGGGDEDEE